MHGNNSSGRREDGFRPKTTLTFPKSQKKFTPKGWSHQNDLTNAVGKKIRLRAPGMAIEGEVLAADQFTVKVRKASEVTAPGDPVRYSSVVVFKSALTSFEVLE